MARAGLKVALALSVSVAALGLIGSVSVATEPYACLGGYEVCPSTGECVLDPSLCGHCSKGQYLCPMSSTECVADAAAYTQCSTLKGTWLDYTKTDAERLDLLMAATNATTRAQQLVNAGPAVPELGIPQYQWLNDDEHGIRQPYGTIFPSMCSLGASFNKSKFWAVGNALAHEARGIHNGMVSGGARGINPRVNAIGVTAYAPMINLAWNPFWGRNQESVGEEPVLVGNLMEQFVIGLQATTGEGSNRTIAMACAKHYAANIFESNPAQRNNGTSTIDAHTGFEYHLAAFQQLVAGPSQVAHVMCSYNSVTDTNTTNPAVPTCGSEELLTDLLRTTWQRRDDSNPIWVVSDYDAFADIASSHDLCANSSDWECAATMAWNAGGDQEGGGTQVADSLPAAVAAGSVKQGTVDASFRRLFAARLRLGFHDPPMSTSLNMVKNDTTVVQSAAHLEVARTAAREGMVLLQNNDSALPLKSKNLAVIGWHASSDIAILGNYDISPGPCTNTTKTGCVVTFVDGLIDAGMDVVQSQGCTNASCATTGGFKDAVDAAMQSDVDAVVYTMGLAYLHGSDSRIEREGHDRTDLSLYPGSIELLRMLFNAVGGKKPIVVVLVHGGPVLVEPIMSMADAILDAHYPGMQGGNALADVLLGKESPAGRLTMTYPSSNDAVSTPMDTPLAFEFYKTAKGATYRYLANSGPGEGAVTLPFGYGLSYTSFTYSNLRETSDSSTDVCTATTFAVDVTNSGSVDSDEAAYQTNGWSAPKHRLTDFARVHIAAGQTVTVTLSVTVDDRFASGPAFSLWKPNLLVYPGAMTVFVGGGQPGWYAGGISLSTSVGSGSSATPLSECSPYYPAPSQL